MQKCRVTGKDYLLCDYNRDGDSYRYKLSVSLSLARPRRRCIADPTAASAVTRTFLPAGLPLRSPWSNEYSPPLPDGATPSERLRKLEIQANDAFDTYREMYFEGGISSVYVWDLEKGFAAVVLIKKGACAVCAVCAVLVGVW